MAYNVLKGIVEGSVDQHADQEINGVKIFKNTISASVFYDTDAQSPCATENNVAICSLESHAENGILTYQGNKIAKSHHRLTFDGRTLSAPNGEFGTLTGSAGGLRHIPAGALVGRVDANCIEHSHGLQARGRSLVVNATYGLKASDDGVGVNIQPHGAIGVRNHQVMVDIENSHDIQERGQNLSTDDLLLVHDSSRNESRHTTLQNLYDGFLKTQVPQPAGPKHSLQINGGRSLQGASALLFEPSHNVLSLKGTLRAAEVQTSTTLQSHGTLEINGAIHKAIKLVTQPTYEFESRDNTVLFDPSANSITAMLPPASENRGRIITVKRVVQDENKYRIRGTHSLTIKTYGEMIDFSKEINIKSNYAIRGFQSDGNKWWIINLSGT